MKKILILALSLSLIFTGCAKDKKNTEENSSSNQKITEKSNQENNLTVGEEENLENTSISSNEKGKKSKNLSNDEIRKAMVDIGGFSKKFVDNFKDEDIKKYEKKAEELREKTGFWNKLTLFFSQVAKDNENSSKIYPDISVDEVENWVYSGDENTDNYKNARRYLKQRGFDASEVPNGILREVFFKVYDENKLASYEKQIDKAYEKLKEKYPNGYVENSTEKKDIDNENKNSQKNKNRENGGIKKFAEKNKDYDEFRKELVDQYGFSKESVEKISNEDIDLANYRAKNKLEETGYGDIGLVINEIAKMYPGASTMYSEDDN
ncbi:hypothetical protein [Anaerococcus ihuae]|uniref:hypothetical protein n=1 Tax=Anaerococcus ihuae TaxID=2899519 RepID=UPI001F35BCB8|nr:hypothetical protein [Anaerococcus ihuae]